jgi:GT2 family glycosyltransferase
MAKRLSISIVVFNSPTEILKRCVQSLSVSAEFAVATQKLSRVDVFLINNSPDNIADQLLESLCHEMRLNEIYPHLITGHGNVGYGRGHNLGIFASAADHHLIVNPDVFFERDTITAAFDAMELEPLVGFITPAIFDADNHRQNIGFRRPTLLVLLLRGFAPAKIKKLFRSVLQDYTLADMDPSKANFDIPIGSGCFMYFNGRILREIGGFSPEYFLYFEDFDLSLKVTQSGKKILYSPKVRITHLGGNTAKKGIKHIKMFVASGVKFFKRHGLRIFSGG